MIVGSRRLLSWTRRACAAWLVVGAAFLLVAPGRAEADANALWNIVHNLCVPNEERNGKPAPCTVVNLTGGEQHGYVLLKDLVGATQFLLMPTAKIAGIEDPDVLAPDATNYFAIAWQSRTYIERVVHATLPRDDVSLAVNSMYGRSQNELHIHIDCVRSDVRHILRSAEPLIQGTWTPLPVPLAGHPYLAMRVTGEQLAVNPFQLLADGVPGARDAMGYHTLVVVGATFDDGQDGFIILDGRADAAAGNSGSGEELQDHTCAS
jgi:CDP-diacylglycerol pyrophosphatase